MKDEEIIEGFKGLYSGAIADVLWAMGHRSAIDPRIRPIYTDVKICGRALTVRAVPARAGEASVLNEVKEICKPGDVIVIDTGGNIKQTLWGDNSATACRVRGGAGAIIDGACRDVAEIRRMRFPTYCRAISPGMEKNALRPMAYNVTVTCGGIQVRPGDIIFGDDDGVVVIPKEIAEDVLKKTKMFVQLDSNVKDLLLQGKSVAEAYEAKAGWTKIIAP